MSIVRKKLDGGIGFLLRLMRINLSRAYYSLIIIMGISPIAYFLYVLMNANQKSTSVLEILNGSPYATVMIIVSCMDIIVGYSLWNFRKQLLNNRTAFIMTLLVIAVQQLLLGNIISAVGALASIYFREDVPKVSKASYGGLIAVLSVISIMYVFCLWMIARLALY